jgi:hypothetical protein
MSNIYTSDVNYIIGQLRNHENNLEALRIHAALLFAELGGPYGNPHKSGGSLFVPINPKSSMGISIGIFQIKLGMCDAPTEELTKLIRRSTILPSGTLELVRTAVENFGRFVCMLKEMARFQRMISKVMRHRQRFILQLRKIVERPFIAMCHYWRHTKCTLAKQVLRLQERVSDRVCYFGHHRQFRYAA